MHGRFGLFAKAFVPHPGRLAPDRGLARGDFLGEVEPDQARPCGGALLQIVEVEDAIGGMRDDGVGHALFADQRGERAGVDARQGNDAALLQPLVETTGGAVVGRVGDIGLEHGADGAGPRSRVEVLDVLAIGADIADMREGEGDDLAGIGRIGEDFLVAGECRVEADFGDGGASGAEAATFDDGAVSQHQQGGRLFGCPRGGHLGHGGTPIRLRASSGPASHLRSFRHGNDLSSPRTSIHCLMQGRVHRGRGQSGQ